MTKKFALVLAFALVASLFAVAGEPSTANVPKLIRIGHYEVKPGKMNAHDDLVKQVRQAATAGNAQYNWIAARPMTGNTNETVFVNFFDTYAQVEESSTSFYKAAGATFQNADFTRAVADTQASINGVIGSLREDLSYRPEKLDVANARTWEVTLIRLKPGTEMDFADMERESIELHKRNNIDEHWVAYQVQYGLQAPALIFITSLRTLGDLDKDLKEAHKSAFTPTIRRRFSDTARDSILFERSTLLSVRPEISKPADTLVAANPEFWTVKEEPTAVATKGKKAKSTAGVQPAAMKTEEKKN
jgi:hypothetical protein